MNGWIEAGGEDDNHRVWLLEDDRRALLARVETAEGDNYCIWAIDHSDVRLFARFGMSQFHTLTEVQNQAEQLLIGGGVRGGYPTGPRIHAYRGWPRH